MQSPLEHILTHSYKDGMISFMGSHPEVFEEAIELAISDKQPYSWRAAWLLWSCLEKNDPRIRKHIKSIINNITTKEDGHQRELIKILLQMELKEEHEGILFNICVNIWEQINKNPSVRFTAMRFITKMARKYPELSQEVQLLIRDEYMDSLSPGVRKSISKMMKEIELKVNSE